MKIDGAGMPEMSSVGEQALTKCRKDHDRVRVTVEFPRRRVETTVNCNG